MGRWSGSNRVKHRNRATRDQQKTRDSHRGFLEMWRPKLDCAAGTVNRDDAWRAAARGIRDVSLFGIRATNKKPAIRIAGFSKCGARSWTRTNDPLINSQVL
jgi:hypothetical protein